jgi:hypothetical protein
MASSTLTGPLYATAATSAIGVSVAVSELLIHYPVVSAQATWYAIGARRRCGSRPPARRARSPSWVWWSPPGPLAW